MRPAIVLEAYQLNRGDQVFCSDAEVSSWRLVLAVEKMANGSLAVSLSGEASFKTYSHTLLLVLRA